MTTLTSYVLFLNTKEEPSNSCLGEVGSLAWVPTCFGGGGNIPTAKAKGECQSHLLVTVVSERRWLNCRPSVVTVMQELWS